MSDREFVTLEVDPDTQVGTVRIDRPPMNALAAQVWRELGEVCDEAVRDGDCHALVVWGGPKVFAAGADIKEFPNWDYQDVIDLGVLQIALNKLQKLPMVTIAAITGFALGGGCELAMACDFRFVSEDAKLGQPEILLGIIPGAGGTQRLPRLVGVSRAKELIYSGRMIDAQEALDIGLADAVHPTDDVLDQARSAAARYASGPFAIRLAKQAIEDGLEMSLENGLRLERSLFAGAFATQDARIGIESFVEHGPGKAEFVQR